MQTRPTRDALRRPADYDCDVDCLRGGTVRPPGCGLLVPPLLRNHRRPQVSVAEKLLHGADGRHFESFFLTFSLLLPASLYISRSADSAGLQKSAERPYRAAAHNMAERAVARSRS